MSTDNDKAEVGALVVMDRPELPALVDVNAARAAWENYLELKEAVLDDEDYLWSAVYKEAWNNRDSGRSGVSTRRTICESKAEAVALATEKDGRAQGKIKKSGCLKLARFFNLELPAMGGGAITAVAVEGYILQTETGDGYTVTSYLKTTDLTTLKASAYITIQGRDGRRATGGGGAHASEKFADFAVAEVAWTRALSRAIITLVGMGDTIDADQDHADADYPEDQGPPNVDPETGEIKTPEQTPEPPEAPAPLSVAETDAEAAAALAAEDGTPTTAEQHLDDLFGSSEPMTLGDLQGYVARKNRSFAAFEKEVGVKGDAMENIPQFRRIFDGMVANGKLPEKRASRTAAK